MGSGCTLQLLLLVVAINTSATLPCNMTDYPYSITSLNLYECEVTQDDLIGYTELKTIRLGKNSLAQFPDLSHTASSLTSLYYATTSPSANSYGNITTFFERIAALQNLEYLTLILNYHEEFPVTNFTLPKLCTFEIFYFNYLSSINSAFLKGLTELKTFRIYGSLLTTMPDISASVNLTLLSITYSWISTIEDGILQSLKQLNHVNLRSNRLTNFPDLSASGDTLTYLDLQTNQISNIDPTLIQPLVKLERLHLNDNPLGAIDENLFLPLISIKALLLEATGIQVFPRLHHSIEELSMMNNELSTIRDDVLENLVNLKNLRLSRNLLTRFPNMSGPASSLQYLFLDGNNISDIQRYHLKPMVNLLILDVGFNPMLASFPHVPDMLTTLKTLQISSTNISHLNVLYVQTPSDLTLGIHNSIDLCACNNAWIKQMLPLLSGLNYDDVTCGTGSSWSSLTTQQLLSECTGFNVEMKIKKFMKVMKEPVAINDLLLNSQFTQMSLLDCSVTCSTTPGCLAYYYRPRGAKTQRAGDCVIVAPDASQPLVEVPDADSPVWFYYGTRD